MREVGNRAAKTFRSGQWRDNVPERNAVILFSGQLPFLLAAGSARPQREQVVWSLGLVFTSAT